MYGRLKNAIYDFQHDAVDAPILWSMTNMSSGFKALLGRRLKSMSITALPIVMFVLVVISLIGVIVLSGSTRTSLALHAIVWTMHICLWFFRRFTILSITDKGLELYFTQTKFSLTHGLKYVMYDKINLSYDRMTNVRVKRGWLRTSFRFEFTSEGKSYKVKTYVLNKSNEMSVQATNLKYLVEMIAHWCSKSEIK